MNDQHVNILFVSEVEKHPILYNSNLPGYSNRIENERAWNEVGKHMYMTAPECRERWKNLRAVYVRNMKQSKNGSGLKASRKTYYLTDAMKFTLPYIKVLNKLNSENQTNPIGRGNNEEQEDLEDDQMDDNESVSLSSDNFPSKHQQITSSLPQQLQKQQPPSSPTPHSAPSFQETISTDPTFQYLEKMRLMAQKKMKLDHVINNNNRNPKTEALKMFLLSMVPDLQKMTDEEVRQFKRKSLETIDDIFMARNFALSSESVGLNKDVKSEYLESITSPYNGIL
ncbi:transcription factor Adf-1-like [Episyrphus balteatus]|uniref:transcription factor Adf-1-like n=1 Tax=Episyrphus balteatus TaxID=286459 RepID=UPI002486A02D|nr:transcription factor Adf-1-like [Episyrphus balteatus]